MRAVLCVLATSALLQVAPPSADERERRARHIERAVGWLADTDPELRDAGRKQVLEFGREAIGEIEKKLEERGALILANTLREIDKPGETFVAARDLMEETLPKLDPVAADKYVLAKYAEAMVHAKKGNYQRGFDLSNALWHLEPKGTTADKVKALRTYCDRMITQTTLVEAKVIQDRPFCAVGDKLELTLRMKNVYKSAMSIKYADGDPLPPNQGMAVLEIEARVYDWHNTTTSFSRHEELHFETEIPIASGAQWEKKFELDTSAQVPDKEQIWVFTVNAWTHPLTMETDGRPVTRKVTFEPAVIKAVPPKYAGFLADPLASLDACMEKGTVHEVFLCSQLLEGDKKEQGLERLIQWLQKADNPKGREAASWILLRMTGERLGPDPRKWADWWQKRGKKPK